jgi:hypothetical protein
MAAVPGQNNMETIFAAHGEAIALLCRARAVADSLMAQLDGGTADPETIGRLQRLVHGAQELVADAAPSVTALGSNLPMPAQAIVEQTAELMQDVLDRVHKAEARATVVLGELATQLENASKSTQMRRAYGKSR